MEGQRWEGWLHLIKTYKDMRSLLNYVTKEQIKKYAKLSDDCYSEWSKLSPFDDSYRGIRDKGMCYDAIVNALQELLKG